MGLPMGPVRKTTVVNARATDRLAAFTPLGKLLETSCVGIDSVYLSRL